MTAGLSAANIANGWLETMRGTSFTGIATPFVKLHTGDPGATGATAAAVGSATRVAITWSAASAGAIAMSGTAPTWTNGGTSETLTHLSFWTASSGGNFLASVALSSSQAWANGNTFTLTAQGWALTPVAA